MTERIRLASLLPLLLLKGLCATAQPANGAAPTYLRAIYRLDYRPDSAEATPQSVQMILRINNGVSCFEGRPKQVFDSVYVSLRGRPAQEQVQKAADASCKPGRNEFRYSIMKEPARGIVAYHDIIGTEDFQYQEPTPLFHWEIKPAKQVIAGYECQQAFTAFSGRVWEAWFARDVPVSDGPYKFYGLPGLILKVRDTYDHYVFGLLSLDPNAGAFDIATDSGAPLSSSQSATLIKKAKFRKAKHTDDLTIFDRFASWGNIIPEGMQKDYFAKLKRQNNPLELK